MKWQLQFVVRSAVLLLYRASHDQNAGCQHGTTHMTDSLCPGSLIAGTQL